MLSSSPVWSIYPSARIVRAAEQIQRMGATSIIAGFKTIALVVAEAEASLMPATERWNRQLWRFWVDLHILPAVHPILENQDLNRTEPPTLSFPAAAGGEDLWECGHQQPGTHQTILPPTLATSSQSKDPRARAGGGTRESSEPYKSAIHRCIESTWQGRHRRDVPIARSIQNDQ